MRNTLLQLLSLYLSALLTFSSSDLWTRRSLENGNVYIFDGTDSPPGEVERVRLVVTATQVKQSSSTPVHILRIRWSEARNAAAYRVLCKANATNEVVTLLDREILDHVTGIDERFVLPQGRLSLMCGVASANSFGSSNWTYSPMVTIQTSTTSTPAIDDSDAESVTDKHQVAVEELSLDQLLKLIHNSSIENLPTLPIERPPEVRIIVKPDSNADDGDDGFVSMERFEENTSSGPAEDSGEAKAVDSDADEGDVDRDYKTLEEDIRRAIGADEASRLSRIRSLQVFGLIDRVF